jgi:regulator of replication initiation timing
MTEPTRNELTDYVIRLGKHINQIYEQLQSLDARVISNAAELTELKTSMSTIRREAIEQIAEHFMARPQVTVTDLPRLPALPEDY